MHKRSSSYTRFFPVRRAALTGLLAAALVAALPATPAVPATTAASATGGSHSSHSSPPSGRSGSARPRVPTQADDALAGTVLASEAVAGWNPQTDGLWVNWVVGPAGTAVETNVGGDGVADPPAGASARHDALTDLRYLHNLWAFEHDEPANPQFRAEIARFTPIVKAEYSGTGDQRGWVYDELMAIATLSGDGWYAATAKNLAASYAEAFDPHLGSILTDPSGSGSYRVDHVLEEGAALVEAGESFQQKVWVADGEKVLSFVHAHAYLPAFGIYLKNMDHVWSATGRVNPDEGIETSSGTGGAGGTVDPGDIGQEAASLLAAGTASGDATIVGWAEQLLSAFSPAVDTIGLWNRADLGYYEEVSFPGSTFDSPGRPAVATGKVEVGREMELLLAYTYADGVLAGAPFRGVEDTLRTLAETKAYYPAGSGWLYEERPDWTPVVINACHCTEDWVTSESDGIVLEAVQATGGPVGVAQPVDGYKP